MEKEKNELIANLEMRIDGMEVSIDFNFFVVLALKQDWLVWLRSEISTIQKAQAAFLEQNSSNRQLFTNSVQIVLHPLVHSA